MKNMKGQAAMEYLMTYGWALLVIVIVIAVLLVLNPFKPATSCNASPGFTCNQPTPVIATGNSGALSFKVINGQQKQVRILGFACTNVGSAAPAAPTTTNPPQTVSQGQSVGQAQFPVICTDSSGQPMNTNTGDRPQGQLHMYWNYADDVTANPRIESMTFVADVV